MLNGWILNVELLNVEAGGGIGYLIQGVLTNMGFKRRL